MFGLHAAYGHQLYWDVRSSDFPDAYVQPELRLAVPVGIGPVATKGSGFMVTFGAVLSVTLAQTGAMRVRSFEADASPPVTFRAPFEGLFVFQLLMGRPPADRER